MASKPIVTLPDEWIVRSKQYAEEVIVAGYRDGRNAASRAVSSHGAEANVGLQWHGRMAECVMALSFGLNPDTALNWSDRCDPGWDLIDRGVRWDVKWTRNGRYLIWPINKRHIFGSKKFDALALVRGTAPRFVLAGFTLKGFFEHEHFVADHAHCLDAGTWYLHEHELWPITPRETRQ